MFGHEEGLAQTVGGHHFVAVLRCPVQRLLVTLLARELEAYTTKAFGPPEVLEIKELINASGVQLRLPTASKRRAGLASSSGYNAMNWKQLSQNMAFIFEQYFMDLSGFNKMRCI